MKKLMVVLAVLAFACAAQAAIIAEYTFTGSSAASSDAEANSTAGAFSVSTGTLLYTTSSSTAWIAAGGAVPVADFSGGMNITAQSAATKYWQFTIAPEAGYQITITSLNFLYNVTAASAQNLGWSIAGTSYDSFVRAATVPTSYASAAQSIVITSATTIHIEGWNATSTGGNFRIDNVVLNGNVTAIPEPATMGLLGLGALAMVLRRKMSK